MEGLKMVMLKIQLCRPSHFRGLERSHWIRTLSASVKIP